MAAICARWALSLGAMVLLPTPLTMPFWLAQSVMVPVREL